MALSKPSKFLSLCTKARPLYHPQITRLIASVASRPPTLAAILLLKASSLLGWLPVSCADRVAKAFASYQFLGSFISRWWSFETFHFVWTTLILAARFYCLSVEVYSPLFLSYVSLGTKFVAFDFWICITHVMLRWNSYFPRLKGHQKGPGYASFAPTRISMSRWSMIVRCTHLLQLRQCRNPFPRNLTTVLVPLL